MRDRMQVTEVVLFVALSGFHLFALSVCDVLCLALSRHLSQWGRCRRSRALLRSIAAALSEHPLVMIIMSNVNSWQG